MRRHHLVLGVAVSALLVGFSSPSLAADRITDPVVATVFHYLDLIPVEGTAVAAVYYLNLDNYYYDGLNYHPLQERVQLNPTWDNNTMTGYWSYNSFQAIPYTDEQPQGFYMLYASFYTLLWGQIIHLDDDDVTYSSVPQG